MNIGCKTDTDTGTFWPGNWELGIGNWAWEGWLGLEFTTSGWKDTTGGNV